MLDGQRWLKDGRPNFRQLARVDKEFAQYLRKGHGKINFQDEEACRALTKAIFLHEFGLVWSIPTGHLSDRCLEGPICGIDIGTGASCVYPLLGTKMLNFSFVATEVDEESIDSAKENVRRNNLESVIQIRKVEKDQLLEGVLREDEKFHFLMCNPPFYANTNEAGSHPYRVKTGDERQMVTRGGEVEFVTCLAKESMQFKHQIRWFSSLVGRKKDLSVIQRYIQQNVTLEVRRTCLKLSRTSRWIIAWRLQTN
eukprot:jgi/Galph1/2653/GphlegSOOS_G1319.1